MEEKQKDKKDEIINMLKSNNELLNKIYISIKNLENAIWESRI